MEKVNINMKCLINHGDKGHLGEIIDHFDILPVPRNFLAIIFGNLFVFVLFFQCNFEQHYTEKFSGGIC